MNETQRAIINEAKGILRDCQQTIKGRLPLLPRDSDMAAAEAAREAREAVALLMQMELSGYHHERAGLVLIDQHTRLIGVHYLNHGDATSCSFDYRRIASLILEHGAYFIVMAHNHPSGYCEPSAQDIKATKALQSWLEPLGVTIVDHLIFTQGEWTDMRGNWK